ncbi:MAG: CHAT domain-containing protein [Bacteroidetes bacterium]|nr:CHAT domain-containing protein [Bacteroidota bacterium]
MSRYLGLILVIFFPVVFFGQVSKEIDSLKKEIVYLDNQELSGNKVQDSTYVKTLNYLSDAYITKGDYDSAIYFSQAARQRAEKAGYGKGLGLSYIRTGTAFEEQGEYPVALENYQKALEVFIEIGNRREEAGVYLSFGNTLMAQGNLDKAQSYYFLAREICDSLGDERGLLSIYGNIGSIHFRQKRYDQALDYFLKVIPLAEKFQDQIGLAIALGNIGSIYTQQEDYEQGIFYFERSLAIKEQLGDVKSIALTNYNIGSLYFNRQMYENAIGYFTRSYEIFQSIHAVKWLRLVCMSMFQVNRKLENHTNAHNYALQLLEMNRKAVELNFSIFSEKEKELYLKMIGADFEKFNAYAYERNGADDTLIHVVYNTVLFYKGLLLKSSTAMKNAVLSSGNTALINDYQTWIELKKQIVSAYTTGQEIKQLEEEADALEKELMKRSADLSNFALYRNITWENVRDVLTKEAAAIEFIRFKHEIDSAEFIRYCALVVKPGSKNPEMIELFEEHELEAVLGNLQANNLDFVNAVYGKQNTANTQLYKLIWEPLEASLANTRKVYISSAGLLHKVSFAALSPGENSFLCDRYDIRMVSSTAKVALPEQFELTRTSAITLFGGIAYSNDQTEKEIWNYLEGTLAETETITENLEKKGIPVSHYKGSAAMEQTFKQVASTSGILHIATHGFFYPDPKETQMKPEQSGSESGDLKFRGRGFGYTAFVENDNPLMRSGLVFAAANNVWSGTDFEGEDGVLTAQEVAHIDMRGTQLVVLSACETGLGDIRGSEGVYGLQRAFKMAGAKFIIMSLWQVPDKETAEFMTLFYKKLLKYKEIHRAFNETQLALRKKYDPYYWAAFVLIE